MGISQVLSLERRWEKAFVPWCPLWGVLALLRVVMCGIGVFWRALKRVQKGKNVGWKMAVILLMVQKSGVHQLRLVVYPIVYDGF